MKILVIGGGISNERKVSLASSSAVFESAKQSGHEVLMYDWDGSEKWLRDNVSKFDVVLPILHGSGGEDGVIQFLLESLHAQFLGSASSVSKNCFDKQATRRAVVDLGYNIPRGEILDYESYVQSNLLRAPHVAKPILGGSSLDTHIIKNIQGYDPEDIRDTFDAYKNLLVEEYIDGTEITVPVLDGEDLPVIEIIPPEGGLFDYENKYNGTTKELCPPKNINRELQQEAISTAKRIHRELGCRHLSRTDMIVKDGKFYFLEINTMPGLTEQSLFPKAAKTAGLDMAHLVEKFIQLTMNGVY